MTIPAIAPGERLFADEVTLAELESIDGGDGEPVGRLWIVEASSESPRPSESSSAVYTK